MIPNQFFFHAPTTPCPRSAFIFHLLNEMEKNSQYWQKWGKFLLNSVTPKALTILLPPDAGETIH